MTKSLIFILTLYYSTVLLYPQKVVTEYKVKNSINDSLVIKSKTLSDEKIQNGFEDVLNDKKSVNFFKNANLIEDDLNRKFQKITIRDTSVFLRVLAEGHYNLYVRYYNKTYGYIIISPSDTIFLTKNDKIENNYYKNDIKYKGYLTYLAKDYPELMKKAQEATFNQRSIQSFIYDLNNKYKSEENTEYIVKANTTFLQLGINGYSSNNKKYYIVDILADNYKLDLSTNISVRFGIIGNYFEKTTYYPEIWSVITYSLSGPFETITNTDISLIQIAHKETNYIKYIGIPFIAHYEFTNSFVTPCFYIGFLPMLYNQVITRTDSDNKYNSGWDLKINVIGGLGVKAKITKNFNILTDCRFDNELGVNLNFGIEYNIKLLRP